LGSKIIELKEQTNSQLLNVSSARTLVRFCRLSLAYQAFLNTKT